MTDSMRDRIAGVLHVSDVYCADLPFEAVSGSYRLMADALLSRWPVLAGVTGEMVEAGARADFEESENGADWETAHPAYRLAYLDHARAVLAAVLGPRDGSTR